MFPPKAIFAPVHHHNDERESAQHLITKGEKLPARRHRQAVQGVIEERLEVPHFFGRKIGRDVGIELDLH